MLAHHLQRWPNINQTLGQRLVFAGNCRAIKQHKVHHILTNSRRFTNAGIMLYIVRNIGVTLTQSQRLVFAGMQ